MIFLWVSINIKILTIARFYFNFNQKFRHLISLIYSTIPWRVRCILQFVRGLGDPLQICLPWISHNTGRPSIYLLLFIALDWQYYCLDKLNAYIVCSGANPLEQRDNAHLHPYKTKLLNTHVWYVSSIIAMAWCIHCISLLMYRIRWRSGPNNIVNSTHNHNIYILQYTYWSSTYFGLLF